MLDLRVVVALGRIAFDNYLESLGQKKTHYSFRHNATYSTGPGAPMLIASFHPSQQNTSTGKLTESMLEEVFRAARRLAS